MWRLKLRFNFIAFIKHIAITALICFVASIFLRANFWVVFLIVEAVMLSNILILGKSKANNPFMRDVNSNSVIDVKKEN